MTIRRCALTMVMAALCATVYAAPARADGGAVRVVEQQEGYQVSVFTAPHPLRAGGVDVSALVQDAATGEGVDEESIVVTLTPAAGGEPIQAFATREAATNKLLRSAMMELPAAGEWNVQVTSEVGGKTIETRFMVTAGPALPRWLSEWVWFTWPVAAVGLFGVHRWLARRRIANSKLAGPTVRFDDLRRS